MGPAPESGRKKRAEKPFGPRPLNFPYTSTPRRAPFADPDASDALLFAAHHFHPSNVLSLATLFLKIYRSLNVLKPRRYLF
jgi:hypothetical protein